MTSASPQRVSIMTRSRTIVFGLIPIIIILAIWEFSWQLGWYRSLSLPPPSAISDAFWARIADLTLLTELGTTLWRMLIGYLGASALGIAVGVAMGAFGVVNRLLGPLTELLRPIPVSALIPVAILFFGIHSEMKIAMVVYAALWPVLINTYTGVREVDPVLIDTARTFRVSSWSRLLRIQLPAAAPFIAAGMRISLAIAFVVTVVAEMIAGGDGIGSFILQKQRSFQVPDMYAAIVALAIVGYLLNASFVALERRVVFWGSAAHIEAN